MDNPGYQKPLFYQSANADEENVRENFLVRLHEYDIIIKDILHHPMTGAVQHFLLIGRRGSGKSTLLKRLQVEIMSNAALKDRYVAVNLAEEQANIYKLYDLLEEILHELQHYGIIDELPKEGDDPHDYTRELFGYLHQAVTKSRRKIILLLDNIDRIFENIDEEASLLREYLLNYDDIRIIGGSTRMTEHFWKYNKPFYQFFRVLELRALTTEEVRCLLLNWAEKMQLPQLKEFVETRPGQLETIRLLTDGLPRTLRFFVDILLTNTQETGYEYLRYVMDSVTPLYQERLNTLPPAQRKLVLQMAFIWESIGTGKLADATKMSNNVISAQLKQLAEKGIVEKIDSGNKNHLYRLSERFFNLWLIFTQGSPKEKRKAKYLTIFLENFYDAEQIQRLAEEHIDALDKGLIAPNKAALLTKAFAQSRYIKHGIRERLIADTLKLKNISEDVKNQLPPTIGNLVDTINNLLSENKFDQALKIAASVEQEDGFRELMQGAIYLKEGKLDDATTVLLRSIQKGCTSSANLLAAAYNRQKDYLAAEKYYLEFLNSEDDTEARFELGIVYLKLKKYSLAKEQFLVALEADKEYSVKIGYVLTMKEHNYKEAEFFLRQGVEANISGAATGLAFTQYMLGKNKLEALDLLQMDKKRDDDNSRTPFFGFFEILVTVWCGNLLNIKEKVLNYLKDTDEFTEPLLLGLLYHGQPNIVYQLFNSPEFSTNLLERYLPIYYTTLLLTENKEKASLKIPPEIRTTVDNILDKVLVLKDFYNGKLKYPT